jgi:N utilization substance protein B
VSEDISNIFPLSRTKVERGNRRLAREKVLQIIFAYRMSESDVDFLFSNIVNREFNFGDTIENLTKDKILKPEEVHELESDVPIHWSDVDLAFAKNLLSNTLKSSEKTDEIMSTTASNWDLSRMTLIDRVLLQIAVAEFLYHNDIPTKVTINESIDIAKRFSTDKSGNFINGILDSILNLLNEQGLVNKSGRGLVEVSEVKIKKKKRKKKKKSKDTTPIVSEQQPSD